MQTFIAVFLGQVISYLSKILRIGGGSAAPGLYALKLDPDIVSKLSSKIPMNVVVTGTNGKTTTSRMIAHFASKSGIKVIRNHTGSNLERGIASTLINSYSHILSENIDLGIWELDEAAFNTVAPKLKPDIIVFLNVFRDQLDRYGEVDTVVKNWCQTLKNLPPKTVVLVNGDDANTAKLSKCFKGVIQKFGVKDFKIVGESLVHEKEHGNLDYEAKNVKLSGLNGSTFALTIFNIRLTINLPLPGVYHIYDFLAAFAAGLNLSFKPDTMISSLKNFSPAFGRVEKLPFGYIFLIKNPAGATAVFETVTPNIKKNDRMLFALNDNIADGTDVSWIWDANFELLRNSPRAKSRGPSLYVSGARAYDLAVRLKYAGFDPKTMIVDDSLSNALKEATMGLKDRLFVFPTYTAMLKLQSILAKTKIKKHYWAEEN
ncbi:DUF1727 domain-containing protein [Candidatus Daviesbacteria bacterium]|nr:DUF1727 domain-containing protein [Candidatus Daviesbacteria bacterium]